MVQDIKNQLAYQFEVDAKGLNCPLPILRAKKQLAQMEQGQVVRILTTDKGALLDFPAFCKQTGNQLLLQETLEEGVFLFYLQRR